MTIASAIAMVGGVTLSPERWFWAVLTAFLIFSNTQSRGDLTVRALNRTLGTAIGIFIGIGLATLIEGELSSVERASASAEATQWAPTSSR